MILGWTEDDYLVITLVLVSISSPNLLYLATVFVPLDRIRASDSRTAISSSLVSSPWVLEMVWKLMNATSPSRRNLPSGQIQKRTPEGSRLQLGIGLCITNTAISTFPLFFTST